MARARDYMIARREKLGRSLEEMANFCGNGISVALLGLLEEDERNVTHPALAEIIGKKYKLTRPQIILLKPENHRPGKDYDPDKYKISADPEFPFKAIEAAKKRKAAQAS